jgi:hypothetical protein
MDRLAAPADHGPLVGLVGTTYEMQSEFFETDLLPTLFGLGAWDDRNWTTRIGIEKHLAGIECATLLVGASRYRGRPRSLRVEVVPFASATGRALHAKVLLLLHEQAVRLFVGSANLREAGTARRSP